jgi:hypothetical protein
MWISHAQFSRDVAFLLFVLSAEYVLFTPGEVSVIHGKSGGAPFVGRGLEMNPASEPGEKS